MFLKSFLIFSACVVLCLSVSLSRKKREAYFLPDGVEFYIGPIKTTFQCNSGGYFADIDNECQLFHICVIQEFPDGRNELAQYTFACGNQTVFNQFSLTCAHPFESIPCANSPDFYYLNDRLLDEKALLHTDQDVEKFASYFNNQ